MIDHRAQASARVVLLEDLRVSDGRVTIGGVRVIPARDALLREELDPEMVDVRQLVWDPAGICDYVVRSNGSPISVGGLPPWFQQ